MTTTPRYDLGIDVPLSGDAGWLLAAAIAAGGPTTLAELGREVGMSRLQASRAGKRLAAGKLLVERRHGYAVNVDHPVMGHLAPLLYLLTGAHTPARQPSVPTGDRHLPAHLRSSDDLGGKPSVGALVARRTEAMLNEYAAQLAQAHSLAQDAYAATSDERLRDYVHLMLHVGEAVQAAARTLRAAAARQAWGTSPHDPIVTDTEWDRACTLVDLECEGLKRRADRLERARQIGERAGDLRQDIVDTVHRLRSDDELTLEALLGMRAQARTVSELKDQAIAQDLIWHGGTPSMHQVGHAGDALLGAWLAMAEADGRDLVRKMRVVT